MKMGVRDRVIGQLADVERAWETKHDHSSHRFRHISCRILLHAGHKLVGKRRRQLYSVLIFIVSLACRIHPRIKLSASKIVKHAARIQSDTPSIRDLVTAAIVSKSTSDLR